MRRTTAVLLAGVIAAVAASGQEADRGLAGTWAVRFLHQNPDEPRDSGSPLWLIRLEQQDGRWTGSVVASAKGVKAATVQGVAVAGDGLTCTLRVPGGRFRFEGKLARDGGKVLGSCAVGSQRFPTELERTTLKTLDPYVLNQALLAGPASGPQVMQAVTTLLSEAADHKATAQEVAGWAAKGLEAAAPFGVAMQREMALRIAGILSEQRGYGGIALDYARRAQKLPVPSEPPASQQRALRILATALRAQGKEEEAADVDARARKIEVRVQPEPYAGRKTPGDRAVLVELFTGAQCPPCVAADLAFDGLVETYKPADVVCLEYHLHVPGPDPMTNPDTEARGQFYEKEVEGTPTLLLNGKPGPEVGGPAAAGPDKYEECRDAIDAQLETPAKAKLKVAATRKGDRVEITADAADVANPSDRLRLRLVLVEDTVQYKGGNRVPTHHHVVRAMPGGANGFAVRERTARQTASVDLGELRKQLRSYLETFAKEKEAEFPTKEWPFELKKLSAVAFLQDDRTKEVVQAAQAEVRSEVGQAP